MILVAFVYQFEDAYICLNVGTKRFVDHIISKHTKISIATLQRDVLQVSTAVNMKNAKEMSVLEQESVKRIGIVQVNTVLQSIRYANLVFNVSLKWTVFTQMSFVMLTMFARRPLEEE
jgi:hypothetical protein